VSLSLHILWLSLSSLYLFLSLAIFELWLLAYWFLFAVGFTAFILSFSNNIFGLVIWGVRSSFYRTFFIHIPHQFHLKRQLIFIQFSRSTFLPGTFLTTGRPIHHRRICCRGRQLPRLFLGSWRFRWWRPIRRGRRNAPRCQPHWKGKITTPSTHF
jgi:hypothetical protein